MIKGVIMKVKKNYSIVLSDGKFYKIKNKGDMEEGTKIISTKEDIIMGKQKKTIRINKYIALAVVVALIFSILFTSYTFSNKAYVLATVDINPSLELELDKDYKVIKMNALNEDAKTLKVLKLKGMEVEDAVEKIVEYAEENGFIKDDNESYVLVTTVVLDKKANKEQSENGINKTIQKQIEIKAGNSEILKKVNIAINSMTKDIYKEITKNESKKTIEKNIPLGIKVLGDKIDKNDYKSVQEFFEDERNIKVFEENGDIIVNAKAKLNKMVNQVIEMKQKENIDVNLEDLLEEAKKVANSKGKNAEEVFDDMEDLVDAIEDAIEDIEDEKKDKLDDNDDEDDEDYDDEDEDDEDEDDRKEERERERQEELREEREEAEEKAREREEERRKKLQEKNDDDDEDDYDDDDDAREEELERQEEAREKAREREEKAKEEARERQEELKEEKEEKEEREEREEREEAEEKSKEKEEERREKEQEKREKQEDKDDDDDDNDNLDD